MHYQIECVPNKPSKDDVDVGNNPMEIDYPRFIIEKDATAITKRNSSGSSKSESASSSRSNSGSKSLSEEDRDRDKVNSLGSQAKLDDDDNVVQQRGHSEPDTTETTSVLDKENVQPKALNANIEAYQEDNSKRKRGARKVAMKR